MELTLEQKKEKVKDLRPIDDVFFEVLASKLPSVRRYCGRSSKTPV